MQGRSNFQRIETGATPKRAGRSERAYPARVPTEPRGASLNCAAVRPVLFLKAASSLPSSRSRPPTEHTKPASHGLGEAVPILVRPRKAGARTPSTEGAMR